jgi:hypothetical protein
MTDQRHRDWRYELELMIDKIGLSHVLFKLAEVCGDKAEHLRSNWQDEKAAKEWIADARAIEKLAAKIRST